ncbi:MAG: hypothetical protein ACRD4U_05940 [Candidatus Acidiferrales bacterium]
MRRRTAVFPVALSLLAALALALPARAQEPTLEDYRDRLPERTLVCVTWQDLSELETLRATNPVLRLWASPEMKANWKALEDYRRERMRMGDAPTQPSSTRPAGDRARDLVQLMTNPGFMALVAPLPPADASTPPPEPALIVLYDATGKEELIARMAAEERQPGEKRSAYEFEGLTIEETRDADGKPKRYETRLGRWLVEGSDKEPFEAWLQAMREAPAHSLRGSAAYQQAQSQWSPTSQVRGFFNASQLMESLRALPARKPGDPAPAQVMDALGLSDWQVLAFDATLDAQSVRYHVAGQHGGDQPGLLGLLGAPVAEFPSLRLAPPNATSYSVAEVDLLALWTYLQGAADALIPPQQAGMVQGILAMAEGLLGMPVDQLMAAWGSEYSQFSFADADGTLRSVYALSLTDREQVLATLRNVAAQKVVFLPLEEVSAAEGETSGGNTVYFRLMSGPGENEEPPKPSLHLVVAGNWLLVSERKEELETALARSGGGNQPFLGQSPAYQQARNRFPSSLSGFSFLDAERWLETDAARQLLRAILEGAARTSTEPEKKSDAEQDPNADSQADPAPAEEPQIPFPELQIPRGYLKWLLSATTRDARSFRFVGIIE